MRRLVGKVEVGRGEGFGGCKIESHGGGAGRSGRVVHTKTFTPHLSDIMFHAYPEIPAEPSLPSNYLNLPAAFLAWQHSDGWCASYPESKQRKPRPATQ